MKPSNMQTDYIAHITYKSDLFWNCADICNDIIPKRKIKNQATLHLCLQNLPFNRFQLN